MPKMRAVVLKRLRDRSVVKTTGCEETLFKQAHQAHKHFPPSFNPKHWLLCHLGLYKYEFEFLNKAKCAIPIKVFFSIAGK